MRLIQLLEQKNHFLEKLLSLNELQAALLKAGEIDTLDEFYLRREKIIDTIGYIDSQLKIAFEESIDLSEAQREVVEHLLFIKDEYVNHIMNLEMTILSSLETIKNQILKDLIDTHRQRKRLQGYQSEKETHSVSEKV